jgi:hypothetical protein
VAASATAIVLAAHAVQAQTAVAPVAQPGAAASQDATAQQIRDELDRLKREFESVRDTYGARLTALEGKLAQLQGAPAPAAPPAEQPPATPPGAPATPPAAPATPGSAPTASVPQGAAGAGGPEGTLPVYGNASAMSKIFNPDMAVIGNFTGAAGKNQIDTRAPLEMGES